MPFLCPPSFVCQAHRQESTSHRFPASPVCQTSDMGEQQMKFQLSAPWANNTYAIPDKQKSISNDVDQSQKAPEDSVICHVHSGCFREVKCPDSHSTLSQDTTTSRQSTSGQNPGTHCHHCSKRLESVASLQVQLEALHDELQGLIQLRKRQEDQIHKVKAQKMKLMKE